jgi:hypothetical protein
MGHCRKRTVSGKTHRRRHCCKKFIAFVGIGMIGAAIWEELKKPKAERTWHGAVGGVVPYDFRVPTPEKVVRNLWDPEGPVVQPKTFGVGWDPNIGRIVTEVVSMAGGGEEEKARY